MNWAESMTLKMLRRAELRFAEVCNPVYPQEHNMEWNWRNCIGDRMQAGYLSDQIGVFGFRCNIA